MNGIIGLVSKHFAKIKQDLPGGDASLKDAFRLANEHYQELARALALRAKTDPRFTSIHSE